MDIDRLLHKWSLIMIKENSGLGYPNKTNFLRTGHTVILIPNYWPDRHLEYLQEEITHLKTRYRDPLIARMVLGMNMDDTAKLCKCHRHTARNRIWQAKRILFDNMRRYE